MQYINNLNVKQQGPMIGNRKLFEFLLNPMKQFDKNVSERDIQQLISSITNATNLFIAGALDP